MFPSYLNLLHFHCNTDWDLHMWKHLNKKLFYLQTTPLSSSHSSFRHFATSTMMPPPWPCPLLLSLHQQCMQKDVKASEISYNTPLPFSLLSRKKVQLKMKRIKREKRQDGELLTTVEEQHSGEEKSWATAAVVAAAPWHFSSVLCAALGP